MYRIFDDIIKENFINIPSRSRAPATAITGIINSCEPSYVVSTVTEKFAGRYSPAWKFVFVDLVWRKERNDIDDIPQSA